MNIKKKFFISYSFFIILNLVDWATTAVCLQYTDFSEINPVVSSVLKHGIIPFLFFKISIIFFVGTAAALIYKREKENSIEPINIILILFNIILAAACISNISQLIFYFIS
jgi:hypothetical protein